MEKKFRNFDIIVKDNYEDMSKVAADIIASQVNKKPSSVLGLATGSTPLGTYKWLIKKHKDEGVDFSKVAVFNLDEYHPIKSNNNQSYYYFMQQNLFTHININDDNTFIPNGESDDTSREASQYEELITAHGGIDLQFLGLGLNGHIGFNEPSKVFSKATNYAELTESTIKANARFFELEKDVPKNAITMGIGTIMQSRNILLVVSGDAKAEIIEKVIFGDIDPMIPGSILQMHPFVTVVLDKAAAANIIDKI